MLAAYRAFEWSQQLRYRVHHPRGRSVFAADGLPLPPASLRVLVAGTADAIWFVNSGRLTTDVIKALLRQNGRPFQEMRSILHFGCGCGRIVRHWHVSGDVRVVGCDFNHRLVDWCGANLPLARFVVNGPGPPLPDLGGRFDLIYSFSVFTHLPAALQPEWVDELTRVLEPGGFLLVTTHGDRYREQLAPAELAAFCAGELVVKHEDVAGTNLCAAFHPQSYLFGDFARALRVVDFIPGGTIEGIEQDLTLLRKPMEDEAVAPARTLRLVSPNG